MNTNKKALDNNQEQQIKSTSILSQWERLCKLAYQEILDTCENGSLKDLIMLRVEIASEKTNNKRDLQLIDKAIRERFV